ncbi:STAS-like domain-containing protein [Phormidesmis sp. 146-33]
MVKVRKRGEQIRQFILMNVEDHPEDVATLTSQEFGITRQAVNKHIQLLVKQNAIVVKGSKMLNNAIDHSSGTEVSIQVKKTAVDTEIIICDDGEGIFKKIQRALHLNDERHAVLELAKGKLTTDPERHSGQGIFFTSRMFDEFNIFSGNVYFSHEFNESEDWILERRNLIPGRTVSMKLNNNTSRSSKQVFDNFSSGDDYALTKTVVPVRLAQYGDERLVSRSQAKRLVTGVDKFKVAIFDFSDVEAIGQAFADEVFRVFKRQHPEMEIMSLNTNKEVAQMISRAESASTM